MHLLIPVKYNRCHFQFELDFPPPVSPHYYLLSSPTCAYVRRYSQAVPLKFTLYEDHGTRYPPRSEPSRDEAPCQLAHSCLPGPHVANLRHP